MSKKMMILLFAVIICLSLAVCSLQDKIGDYSREQCYLNKENVTQFSYKGNDYTILADTVSNSGLGEWIGYPYLKLGRRLSAEDGRIIDETLRLTGLTALEHRTLRTLSGGERQRAWIAMTVCQQPEILILDEPTTYLDISYQMEVLELVRRLNRELGMTIVMVLHDLNMAARYSDMLYAIRGGRIFASGTPEEVICSETLRAVFKIEADIACDAAHNCPYFIPLQILPDSVGESLADKKSAS